jgi:serine protease Do
MKFRKVMGGIALGLTCAMIGAGVTATTRNMSASAEATTLSSSTTTTVVTSPFTEAVAKVRDSVVGVSNYQKVRYSTYGNSYFGYGFGYGSGRGNNDVEEKEELSSTGSGVVIGEGFVLTNYHVVEDASSLRVTVTDDSNNTTEYAATLVAYDESLDIAIVYATDLDLPAVTLGDSDSLQVGDWAICIGNPLGFSKTTTAGIVSALNRSVESSSTDKYGRTSTTSNAMIQVDAAINSGNSGGGMFSVTGELMGIPTLKYTGSYYSGSTVEGIGMCIPINSAKPLIEKVLNGEITFTAAEALDSDDDEDSTSSSGTNLVGKPRMGITMSNLANSAALQSGQIPKGVYVVNVEENSPAEKAGMQVGDIIVDVDDTVITSTTELSAKVAEYEAGDTLKIKVYRVPGITDLTGSDDIPDGEYIDLEVTLEIIDNVKQ